MSETQKEHLSKFLLSSFIVVILYGSFTNFFITNSAADELSVFGENVVEAFPQAFTVTENDLTILHGAQNGIALSGELIWNGLKLAWSDYKDFPENFLLKIIWLVIGIFIEIIKWFFIMLPVFFIMIYQLFTIDASLGYKIALIVSSFIPPAIWILYSKALD